MKPFAMACALFGAILLTPCVGQTTNWQKVNSGTTSGLKGVHLIDTKRGYATGSGPELLRTTDGGATWGRITLTGATQDLWGVHATSGPAADTITLVGDNGAVHRSVDGGAHWTAQDLHYSQGFAFAVTGTDSRNMYATGYEGSESGQAGLVVVTHDGGDTWVKVAVPGAGTFDKSFFLTSQLGYAVGGKPGGFSNGGLVMKTTDGGLNWTTAASVQYSMNSIYCFDENRWAAVGYEGLAIRTTDGGKNWKKMTIPAGQAKDPFTHILFVDDDLGFITSAYGAMLKTTDGGDTWTRDNSFIAGSTIIWSMTRAESDAETIVLAVGESGSIFRYRIKKVQPRPTIDLSDTELDFETVASGSKELTIEISPANKVELRIDTAYIDGPANGFELVGAPGPWPVALQEGDSRQLTVRFTHADALPDEPEGMLVLETNDPAHTIVQIPLHAKQKEVVDPGEASAVLSATSLAFGKVERNATKEMTFTVSAANASGVRVKSFSIENEVVPGTFVVKSPSGPFPINVQMGAPLTITIAFTPAELTTAAADLYIATDAVSGGDLHVTLAGEGVKPVASVGGGADVSGLALATLPNPIAGPGLLRVTAAGAGNLNVSLYDMMGRRCATLFDGACRDGERAIRIDVSALPAGRYTCVATMNGGMTIEPLTVAR